MPITTEGTGKEIFDGMRVFTNDLDGSRQYGTLRQGETFRGPEDWYVEYDDGQSCIVLDFSTIYDARNN